MNLETQGNYVEVCDEADLWEGDMQAFDVGDHEVLVVNIDGELHAYHGVCPHQNIPLVEGTLEGKVLTCRAHLWQFDACTGEGINPSSAALKRIPIRVVDGRIGVADEAAADAARAAVPCPASASCSTAARMSPDDLVLERTPRFIPGQAC